MTSKAFRDPAARYFVPVAGTMVNGPFISIFWQEVECLRFEFIGHEPGTGNFARRMDDAGRRQFQDPVTGFDAAEVGEQKTVLVKRNPFVGWTMFTMPAPRSETLSWVNGVTLPVPHMLPATAWAFYSGRHTRPLPGIPRTRAGMLSPA
jgi:hypothetical protein